MDRRHVFRALSSMALTTFIESVSRTTLSQNWTDSTNVFVYELKRVVPPLEAIMSDVQSEDEYTTIEVPARDDNAMTATDFIKAIEPVPRLPDRQEMIFKELSTGNIPGWLRSFKAIEVEWEGHKATLWVACDCLCIGSDDDWCRMPMNGHTAQRVADAYGCTLVTKKTATDVWKAADVKLTPQPWGPPYDEDMYAVHRIPTQNQKIMSGNPTFHIRGLQEFIPTDGSNWPLIAGHHKDVVLTPLIEKRPDRLAIFGWFQPNGMPIQGLQPNAHEVTYEDYSHGIRLAHAQVLVTPNGEEARPMTYADLLADEKLYGLVSDEGPSTFSRYPTA